MPKTVVFCGAGPDGCGWYRAVQPAAALRTVGVDARISGMVQATTERDGSISAIQTVADTFLFQRPILPALPALFRRAVLEGRRVVVELDDDLWALPSHNPVKSVFSREALATLNACCALAHAVIVSTAPLAQRVRAITGQRAIVVIPNAINPALAGPARQEAGPLLVGWAGGTSHRYDFPVARAAIVNAQQTPNVAVHFYGDDPLTKSPATPGPRTIHKWTNDMAEHYRNIATFDIALAPVENTLFNRSKSALKWLESALHATPMVLSAVTPYLDATEDGVTALHASDSRDFARQLTRLLHDPLLRQELGARARSEVLEHHTIDKRVAAYRAILEV